MNQQSDKNGMTMGFQVVQDVEKYRVSMLVSLIRSGKMIYEDVFIIYAHAGFDCLYMLMHFWCLHT